MNNRTKVTAYTYHLDVFGRVVKVPVRSNDLIPIPFSPTTDPSTNPIPDWTNGPEKPKSDE